MDCKWLTFQLLLVFSAICGVLGELTKLICDSPAIDLCRHQATVTCDVSDGTTGIEGIDILYGATGFRFEIDNQKIMQNKSEHFSVSLKDRVLTLSLFGIKTDEQKLLRIRIITPQGTPYVNLYIPEVTKELHCDDPVIHTCQNTMTMQCRTNKIITNVTLNWSLNGINHMLHITTENMKVKQQQDQDISVEIKDKEFTLIISNIEIYNDTILSIQINTPATMQSCGISLRSNHYEEDCKAKAGMSALPPESETGQYYAVILILVVLVLTAATVGYWFYHKKKKSFTPEPRERSESQGPLIENTLLRETSGKDQL